MILPRPRLKEEKLDKFAKTFLMFVAIALIALLLAYFLLNSALKSSAGKKGDSGAPQNNIPGSLFSSPRAYF